MMMEIWKKETHRESIAMVKIDDIENKQLGKNKCTTANRWSSKDPTKTYIKDDRKS